MAEHTRTAILCCVQALRWQLSVAVLAGRATGTTARDPLLQPFCSESIWNTPVGDAAVYIDAKIKPFHNLGPDLSHFVMASATDPLVPWYKVKHWGGPRCDSDIPGLKPIMDLRVPDSFVVPDITSHDTPNGAATILRPDRHTLVQMNPVCRNVSGGAIFGDLTHGEPETFEDLYGMGQTGAYGGSGLSALGGSIRPGEWHPAAGPLRHALKVELLAHLYYSPDHLPGQQARGYRWPAVTCDGYAFDCGGPVRKDTGMSACYNGSVPQLQPGALLAVPPSIKLSDLGLVSPPAIKIFTALQDYGAYVVADSAWNSTSVAMQAGVEQEFEQVFGFKFSQTDRRCQQPQGCAFLQDMWRIFGQLHVVDNNFNTSIGGGGAPRVPSAPPLNDTRLCPKKITWEI